MAGLYVSLPNQSTVYIFVVYKMASIIDQDLAHIWHPCSQMKDYETFKPLVIESASGSHIKLANGKTLIDAVSSWWCKSLGHQHPRLKQVMREQIEKFEHVIFANTTHETITLLSEKLTGLTTTLKKVFYAGDGSCAVEIAMKMSLHARKINGDTLKTKFIALQNGYHGETSGALSVSDVGIYKHAYGAMLFDVFYISSLPYVQSIHDPLWHDCGDIWPFIEKQLEPYAASATAIILEPIVQGAGGMKIYSQDFLCRLRDYTLQHNIHLIADEIMTGIGRTGKMLACEHANIEPDFLCLAKGLTSGWLPFSAVLTTNSIYEYFYADYELGRSFLHSHTYSGNALGACLALEVLRMMDELDICAQADLLGDYMRERMTEVSDETRRLTNVRQIGAIVAADIIATNPSQRIGFEVYQKAVQHGALLRPLGNTIYWLPPLNTSHDTIDELARITSKALTLI